jgi:homocysteine S-methyltransferase
MEITLLDGSIGQELVKRSGDRATPLWSTRVMIEKPEIVNEVHAAYFNAGATVATTNTYAVLYDRLKTADLKDQRFELWETAMTAATAARDAHGSGRVAGSIGPLIASYRPDLCPPPDQAAELYGEIIETIGPLVDVLLIETMCSVDQADGAMRAAKKIRSTYLAGIVGR